MFYTTTRLCMELVAAKKKKRDARSKNDASPTPTDAENSTGQNCNSRSACRTIKATLKSVKKRVCRLKPTSQVEARGWYDAVAEEIACLVAEDERANERERLRREKRGRNAEVERAAQLQNECNYLPTGASAGGGGGIRRRDAIHLSNSAAVLKRQRLALKQKVLMKEGEYTYVNQNKLRTIRVRGEAKGIDRSVRLGEDHCSGPGGRCSVRKVA